MSAAVNLLEITLYDLKIETIEEGYENELQHYLQVMQSHNEANLDIKDLHMRLHFHPFQRFRYNHDQSNPL